MRKARILLPIPSEIVHDILVWLPPKSLLRFRLVCKHWNSLILCPEFEKDHLNANQNGNSNLRRFARFKQNPAFHSDLNLESIDCDASDNRVNVLGYPDKIFYGDFPRILGSCNGLLLVGAFVAWKNFLFIWNPSIRKYRQISGRDSQIGGGFIMAGLGYDCNSEDYKVVIAFYPTPLSAYYLYSCKGDSWRTMYQNVFSYDLQSTSSSCVEVNGFPHWIAYKGEYHDTPSVVVVYFDMVEEKWTELSPPDHLTYWENVTRWGKIELGVLKGWLCASHNRKGNCFDVWAMKEYGVAESWTRLFTVSTAFLPFGDLRLMTYTRKGEVLLDADGEKLVIFNMKKRSIKKIVKFKHNFQMGTFVESLVLL